MKSRILSFPPLAALIKRLGQSDLLERFSRGVYWTLVGNVTWRLLSAVSAIIVARILGPESFGEFGMIYSTIMVFAIFAEFQLGATSSKYISEYRKNDSVRVGRILRLALIASFILCGTAGIILVVASLPLASYVLNNPGLFTGLIIGALLMFFVTYGEMKQYVLAGFENFKAIAKVNILRGVATPVVCIPMAYAWGVNGAVAGLATVAVIMFASSSYLLKRECVTAQIPAHTPLNEVQKEISVLWKFSLPGFFIGLIVTLMMWTGRVILTHLDNGYVEIGLFSAADQWRQIIIFLPMALSQVILPILSKAYGGGTGDEFKKAISVQVHSILLITLPVATLVIGLADPLALIYGIEYKGTEAVIPILIVSVFFRIINSSLGLIYTSSGKRWTNLIMHIGWAFAFFLGCLAFIPVKGAVGLGLTLLLADVTLLYSQVLYIELILAPGTLRKFIKLFMYSLFLLASSYFAQSYYPPTSAMPILFLLFIMSLAPAFLTFRKLVSNS